MTPLERPIFCDADNLADFRQALRAQPDIAEFIAALYKAGMIDGLRGITLAPAGQLPPTGGVPPTLSQQAETRVLDAAWQEANAQ